MDTINIAVETSNTISVSVENSDTVNVGVIDELIAGNINNKFPYYLPLNLE